MASYSPGQVFQIMVEDTKYEGDLDERIDVARGLHKLNHQEREFLVSLAHGYTGMESLAHAGYPPQTNAPRLKQDLLFRLTKLINGESK